MGQKIKKIRAKDYRSLKLLSLSPTGSVVRIYGTNGQGKSNALAGIRSVLLGERDGAGDVISHGAGRSEFAVELAGGLVATMKWGASGSRVLELVKIDEDGIEATIGKPRDLLQKLVGPFHDVGAILRIDTPEAERGLRDALLTAAGVSIADLDSEIAAATTARALAAAEAKKLAAKLEGIPTPRADLPEQELSAAALMRQESEIRDKLDARAQAERQQHDLERAVAGARNAVAEAERRLQDARSALGAAEAALLEIELPEAPDGAQLAAVREKLTGLDETNGQIRQGKVWAELVAQHADAKAGAEAADIRIKAAQAAKGQRLASVPLPIPGAEILEDGVAFGGERFHNLSTGQKTVFGVGLGIATRGKLDVLLVDNAEMLDAQNEALIEQMAVAAGVQVFLASAVKSSPGGIFVSGAECEIESAIAAEPEAARGAA